MNTFLSKIAANAVTAYFETNICKGCHKNVKKWRTGSWSQKRKKKENERRLICNYPRKPYLPRVWMESGQLWVVNSIMSSSSGSTTYMVHTHNYCTITSLQKLTNS